MAAHITDVVLPEELTRRMRELRDNPPLTRLKTVDVEQQHLEADRLLLRTLKSLGYASGCAIFEQLEKWYA